MKHDPHRIQKDEFLHKLHTLHKGHPVGDLDLGDLAAGKMLVTSALGLEGVELSVGETIDVVGEMAHAVGGDTKLGAQELASKMDYEKRRRKAGALQRRQQKRTRAMLSRGKDK